MQPTCSRTLNCHKRLHGVSMSRARVGVHSRVMNPLNNQIAADKYRDHEPKGNGLVVGGAVQEVCTNLATAFDSADSRIEIVSGPRYSPFLPERDDGRRCGELHIRLRLGVLRFGAIVEIRPWQEGRAEVTILNGRSGHAAQRGLAYDRMWSDIDDVCRHLVVASAPADQDPVAPGSPADEAIPRNRHDHSKARSGRRANRVRSFEVH